MPISGNSTSMPKGRAASGMIGTMRLPHWGSRTRLRSSLANAIVVETACFSPVPAANSSNTLAAGGGRGVARSARLGGDAGRLAFGRGGERVGRVQLAIVVAAAAQMLEVVVAQVLDDPEQPRGGAEGPLA